ENGASRDSRPRDSGPGARPSDSRPEDAPPQDAPAAGRTDAADNPVAALFHGLGPERAALLPGWAGDAVFPVDEVRRRLPAAEAALAVSGAERERALARIDDWPGEKEAEALLDGPLRVWRETAEAGLGLLASRIWH
ncbi:hypothetical protein AB4Z54_35550, partial [Streptomyces sp. MCAF7]